MGFTDQHATDKQDREEIQCTLHLQRYCKTQNVGRHLPCHFNQNQLGNVIHILNFVVLFACTFILYHTLPSRFRKATLLTASCLFIGFYHLNFSDNGPHPHAYHLLPWQMDRTGPSGKAA